MFAFSSVVNLLNKLSSTEMKVSFMRFERCLWVAWGFKLLRFLRRRMEEEELKSVLLSFLISGEDLIVEMNMLSVDVPEINNDINYID